MKQTILITGTSSGFGKLTAVTLANAGHTVIAAMRNLSTKNKEAAEELSAIANIEIVEMDITNDESVSDSINQILLKHGKIDVLVNNAGISAIGVLEAHSMDQFKRLFETNVFSVFRTYKAVLPSMRKNKNGLIINISSGLGMFSLPKMAPYAASKFAVEALTEGIAYEIKPFGIETVSIQAGAYPTAIMSKTGVIAEEQLVTQAYIDQHGPETGNNAAVMIAKMKEFNMNPQMIADGVLHLVQMEKGARPQQFPIDAVAQGTDQEFIDTRNELKLRWLNKHR